MAATNDMTSTLAVDDEQTVRRAGPPLAHSLPKLVLTQAPTQTEENPLTTAFTSDKSTYSQSLRSSVLDYRYENGRTYHAFHSGSYHMPNDAEEQDRLDLLHHMFKILLKGELYTAPIDLSTTNNNPSPRILDIGCGTGLWAIDVADAYPAATVIGTDLSPIQPSWCPPNVSSYVDDADAEWTFDAPFDYIHGRALVGGIADWPKFYSQALANLKPGSGWMEMHEHEGYISSDDGGAEKAVTYMEVIGELNKASTMVGKPLDVAHQHKRWMEEAGFVDVKEAKVQTPIGAWAKDGKLKELGRLYQVIMLQSMPSFLLAYYTRVLGHSEEYTNGVMDKIRAEFVDDGLHLYQNWYLVTGRRPK